MSNPQSTPIKPGRPNWENKVFLVVEDEEHNFAYIREILKRTKVTILRAESGKEAISVFSKNKIDMVLMDIKLPEMDGYRATQEIKKLDPKVPVIAQTAYAMSQERANCLKAGCDDYISKPYDPLKLIEMIEKHIS